MVDAGELKQAYPYAVKTGDEIAESLSITRLNYTPEEILSNWILYGAHYTSEAAPPYAPGRDPLTPRELCRRVLRAGTLLWVDGAIQFDILDADRKRIVQRLKDVEVPVPGTAAPRVQDVYRVYRQGPLTDSEWGEVAAGDWLLADYNKPELKASDRFYSEVLLASQVQVILNGAGIYFDMQGAYWRLEEIERTMRQQQTGPNAKTYIHGIPRNVEESRAALNDDKYETFIPADVKISRAGASPIIDQLKAEYELLRNEYFAGMNITDVSYTPGRPVADDRYLQMLPMLRAVEQHREIMRQACALFGGDIEFSQIHAATVSDRQAEFDLLTAMLTAQVIDQGEYKTKAKRLI